jgi:hypothetical protein
VSASDKAAKLRERLGALTHAVKAETAKSIARQSIRDEAKDLGRSWFFELRPEIEATGIVSAEVFDKYNQHFTRLVKISSLNNLKTSYLSTLDGLTKGFKAEILLPLETVPPAAASKPASLFDGLFAKLDQADADDAYLKEAVDCARSGFIRAAAVMGWCAAIARIHKAIDRVGFNKFNAASAQMTSQTQGRFKRFNKVQSVTSIDDLRLVFDTDILWILEGMRLIDSNQHTRLRSCFDLRNHSAHPGEAPVTDFNLLSFFSDIIEIVLKNPTFALPKPASAPPGDV